MFISPRSLNSQGTSFTKEQLIHRENLWHQYSSLASHPQINGLFLSDSIHWNVSPGSKKEEKKFQGGFAAGWHIMFSLKSFTVPTLPGSAKSMQSRGSACVGRCRKALPVYFRYSTLGGSLPYWNIIFKGSDSYPDNSVSLWENKHRKSMSCVNVDPYTDLPRVLFRVDNIHC